MSGYFVGYFAGGQCGTYPRKKSGSHKSFCCFCINGFISYFGSRSVFVDPFVWICGKICNRLSAYIGIFIVVESWLNDRANNRTRGQVLSIYMFISLIGLAIGTLLLNFSSPEKYEPFILISIIIIFSN